MSKDRPVLLREFLKGQTLRDWQFQFKSLPFLHNHHRNLIHSLSQQMSKIPLHPTTCEAQTFRNGEGAEDLHYDGVKKSWTLEVCLNQRKPWPRFINHQLDFLKVGKELSSLQLTEGEIEEAKGLSTSYLLNPGDVIFYCGFSQLHWRDPIEAGNFCELALFHFEPRNLSV